MQFVFGRQTSRVLGPALLIAMTLMGHVLAPSALAAQCQKNLHFAETTPQQAADAGREVWVLRTLSATDWAAGGFASEVLWVGTDGQPTTDVTWVEVGVTHGWQSQNLYTYYTAHAINYPQVYQEHRLLQAPIVGAVTTFSVYPSTILGNYKAAISGTGFSELWSWSGHNSPTADYAGGLESTCGTSRVDRTYVSLHQFRDKVTKAWVNPQVSSMVHIGVPENSVWCAAPTKFRYWINSQIPTNLCV